jgi:hypothetical protein
MANPWDADPQVSPLDVALAAEGASAPVAAVSKSIYQQESGSGKNTKTSDAGAVGGMQITPATFASVADPSWDINDPVDNARAGVRYVTQMNEKAGGNPALTAVGYYGGPGAIAKAAQGIAVSDPRNPDAPNTLQYAQQVVSRIPASTPQASTGNPWDNDPQVPESQASQAAQAAPQPVTQATPQAAPQQAAAAPQAAQQSPSLGDTLLNAALNPVRTAKNIGNSITTGVSNLGKQYMADPLGTMDGAVRGLADGATFGLADKAAAGMNTLLKGGTYANNVAQERQADANAGPAFTAGQLASGLLTDGAGAIKLAQVAPTTSTVARAAAGSLGGAIDGAANYMGHNDGPQNDSDLNTNMAIGAALGPLAALAQTTNAQKAAQFLTDNAGESNVTGLLPKLAQNLTGDMTPEQVANAQRSADVVNALKTLQGRATQQGVPLGASDANALAASYTQNATAAIRQLAPEDQQPLINAMNQSKALSDPQIDALRTTPQGNAVADAIQMRQQTMAMTAPTVSNGNPLLKLGRMVVNNGGLGMLTPHSAILGAVTDLAPVRNVITNLLGGRENRGANIASALEQAPNAAAFTSQYGPSAAAQSAQQLQQMGQQAVAQRAAQQIAQAQQAASASNLANSVAVRQQQAQARQLAAQQATQQAQAAQASQAAASSDNLANSVAVRQQQAQARQSAALAAAQQAQGQSSALAAAQQAQASASSSNLANSVAVRQAQMAARQQAAQQAAQAAEVSQAQQMGNQVAGGDFSNATLQKPALAKMMEYNNAPDIAAVQPTLQKLAASNPDMARRVGQLLTPGAKNLSSADFYAINDALKAVHGAKPVAAVQEASTEPALSSAIRSLPAWQSAAVSRQQVQKAALEGAQDSDVKALIGQLATTKDSKTGAPHASREAIYNKFMSSTSDPAKLVEASRLAQPLITYGK